MDISSALRIAIGLHLMPAQYPRIKAAPLPDGVHILLLIAAGNEDEINKAVKSTRHPKETIQQAAISFIENILLSPDADHYRILGANPNASSNELRRNMALMIRYLHPDVSQNENTTFITRVTRAWDDLKTTEKRAAYDTQRRETIKRGRRPRHTPQRSAQGKKRRPSHQKNTSRAKKHGSYRRQWKGAILRQLTLFLMKISGRG